MIHQVKPEEDNENQSSKKCITIRNDANVTEMMENLGSKIFATNCIENSLGPKGKIIFILGEE